MGGAVSPRKQSAVLFFFIAMVLFRAPDLVPYVSGWRDDMSHRTYYLLLAFLHFMPGVGVIFIALAIYRAVTRDKPTQPEG